MLTAKDVMTADVMTVNKETEVLKAARILLENRINGLPVVDEKDNLVGIICQSDLIALQKSFSLPTIFTFLDGLIPLVSPGKYESELKKMAAARVSDAMTANPVAIAPDTPVEAIADLMVERKYHTLPVTENGKLIGVVGKEDLLRALIGQGK